MEIFYTGVTGSRTDPVGVAEGPWTPPDILRTMVNLVFTCVENAECANVLLEIIVTSNNNKSFIKNK
jgi:hypothetical protein